MSHWYTVRRAEGPLRTRLWITAIVSIALLGAVILPAWIELPRGDFCFGIIGCEPGWYIGFYPGLGIVTAIFASSAALAIYRLTRPRDLWADAGFVSPESK